jgi:release factor glutamine methyltransferase
MTIKEIVKKYSNKLDRLDLDLILAHSLGKTREFILTYPEIAITKNQETIINKNIKRRISNEPIAYITGHKEFYGLDFLVNASTLVPRPETELLIELVLSEISNFKFQISNYCIVDVGTGSGCIITAIANSMKHGAWSMEQKKSTQCYATDINEEALKVAKKNAKLHGVEKKIKFLHGNLLSSFFAELNKLKAKKLMPEKLILVANLPYLSKEIYQSAPVDVKKYEPKTALFSSENGLAHYRELLEQINQNFAPCSMLHVSCFLEISPEQKLPLTKLVKTIFSAAKIEFKKDLAGKWRVCAIEISPN